MSVHTELDRILDYCRLRATMASDPAIKQSLYEAMTEFFRFTSVWTTAVSFESIPNVQSYQVIPQPPGQVIRLVGVMDNNRFAWAASMPLGTVVLPTTPPTITPTPVSPGNIVLACAPSVEQTMTAVFVMNVTLPNDGNDLPEPPDWTLPLYSSAFIHGTLAYLLTQPKKPYSDMGAAIYHSREFINLKSQARSAALRGNTQYSQAWCFPQSSRSYTQRGGISVGSY